MPEPEQILSGLRATANDWWLLAIFWHAYIGTAAAWCWAKPVPIRLAGILLSIPFLSVGVLAWVAGNPFNAAVFAVMAAASFIVAITLSDRPRRFGPPWAILSGVALFVFGWLYPHFLENRPLWAYLYAAPTGLIPCPTLSVITGLGLVLGGLGSRAWSLMIGVSGIFYGAFGMIVLGVAIDSVLLAGGLVLFGQAVHGGGIRNSDGGDT